MPNFKKNKVNPYLFVLLKRMLEYEVCGISEKPSKLQIAQFIYARWRRKEFKTTLYFSKKDVRDPIAFRKAESIRKDIFTPVNFKFSLDKLNQLAAEISIIDKFASWNEYVEKYQDDRGAEISERDYGSCQFSELATDDQQKIFAWVDKRLMNLHLEYIRNDKPNNPQIVSNDEDFVIRTINSSEIAIIPHVLGEYSMTDERHQRIKGMFKKNKNIIYIHRDDYDIYGYILLLPIKEAVFLRLQQQEYEVKIEDIYSHKEVGSVKYIFIEDLFCKLKYVFNLFLDCLEPMLATLSELNEELVVCGIDNGQDSQLGSSLRYLLRKVTQSFYLPGSAYFVQFKLKDLAEALKSDKRRHFDRTIRPSKYYKSN